MDGNTPNGDTSVTHTSIRSASGGGSGSGGSPQSSSGSGPDGDLGFSAPHGGGRRRVPEVPEESRQSWVESTSSVIPSEG
jgi:hypothetical protein